MKEIIEAIKNHEPVIVNYGKGYITQEPIREITYWSSDKNRYVSETGMWSIELLLELARGEFPNMSVELMEDE